MRNFIYVVMCLTAIGCSDDEDIDSDEAARRAYLALDGSIEKSIALGFAGFNAASSANIDPQMGTGTSAGTITITGKVDSGSSANKGMRLEIGMVDYDDGKVAYNDDNDMVHVIFNTSTDLTLQPSFDLQLKNFPNGTLEGTLTAGDLMNGVYVLSGDLEGELTLNLTVMGTTMAGAVAGDVVRVPGATTITGTATNSDGGVYNISITI